MAKIKKDVENKGALDLRSPYFDLICYESYARSNQFELINKHYSHLDPKGRSSGSAYTPVDEVNRRFIKLDRLFKRQLADKLDLFGGCPEYLLHERMRLSAELLLSCLPDVISLEITDEKSIFYTWKKNDISIYLDHYLIEEFDGKDEAILSIYKGDEKMADFAGTLDEVILGVNKTLVSESIGFMAFA